MTYRNKTMDNQTLIDIWSEYRQSLKRFLHSKISQEQDAEDLLQDILLKSFQHHDTLEAPEKAKSWLFQIANNAVIDYYRKKGRYVTTEDHPLWHTQEEQNSVISELNGCLLPFIQSLPQEQADLLIESDIHGKSQKDMAKIQQVNYSTIKSRVQVARESLRQVFDSCCGFTLDTQGNLLEINQKKDNCKKC